MRLIKIIGPSIERHSHLMRILVEQAVSLTGGPVVDHFFCFDPLNRITFLAIGFAYPCSYAELDNLYRNKNNIEKSLLNIDFNVKLEHVLLSIKISMSCYNSGKYYDYVALVNNLLYLADCLSFVARLPPSLTSPQDVFVLTPIKLLSIVPVMLKEIESTKTQRLLTVQHNGEYMIACDDLAALNYLLDDKSLAEVYREFTIAQGRAHPESLLEDFVPTSPIKIPVYSSPLKPKLIQKDVDVKPMVEATPQIVESLSKPSYAQMAQKPPKAIVKQKGLPLTWLRNKKVPNQSAKDNAYKAFHDKSRNATDESDKPKVTAWQRLGRW